VVAYSIVISIFGESVMFARAPRYPFVAAHLPLYAALALGVSAIGSLFVGLLRQVQTLSARLPVPAWCRPGIGGLALGLLTVPVLLFVGARIGVPGQGLGLLGGGYGAVQMAITGSRWLPAGWPRVELLLLLCAAKLMLASLTIGTGGSAGDFAPSLALGGLFGGAFGCAAQLVFHDPRIDPGAFALVGMGALYGGIAHVPISALILVSELAGSYELLVPLMLAVGVAFVALRERSLYEAQVNVKSDSPVHLNPVLPDALRTIRVSEVMLMDRGFVSFEPETSAREILRRLPVESRQELFPVLDDGVLKGLITGEAIRMLASTIESASWVIAADLMRPAVSVEPEDDLRTASKAMLAHGLREIPVIDRKGHVLGVVDEEETVKAYVRATAALERSGSTTG
jgi:CIC family chloride channel protein